MCVCVTWIIYLFILSAEATAVGYKGCSKDLDFKLLYSPPAFHEMSFSAFVCGLTMNFAVTKCLLLTVVQTFSKLHVYLMLHSVAQINLWKVALFVYNVFCLPI